MMGGEMGGMMGGKRMMGGEMGGMMGGKGMMGGAMGGMMGGKGMEMLRPSCLLVYLQNKKLNIPLSKRLSLNSAYLSIARLKHILKKNKEFAAT
jgi:hypothetical protein